MPNMMFCFTCLLRLDQNITNDWLPPLNDIRKYIDKCYFPLKTLLCFHDMSQYVLTAVFHSTFTFHRALDRVRIVLPKCIYHWFTVFWLMSSQAEKRKTRVVFLKTTLSSVSINQPRTGSHRNASITQIDVALQRPLSSRHSKLRCLRAQWKCTCGL